MRIALFAVASMVVFAGCMTLTPEERAANTERARRLPAGTVLTDLQIDQLDQDHVLVCENRPDTGSHIPHRSCQTLRKSNEERIRNVQHGPVTVEKQQ